MSELRDKYLKDGFAIIKNFLKEEELIQLRDFCIKNFKKDIEVFEQDLIKKYFFNEKFFQIFREILNCKKLIYFSDSSIALHNTVDDAPAGFHVDSRNENYNFKEEYPIARLGIYLQNIKDFSGGVKIKPGSHNYYCSTKIKQSIKNIFEQIIIKKNKNFKFKFFHKNIQPSIEPGDLIIWNLRLHHSGASWRYKFNKQVSLPPLVDKLIPKLFKIPPQFEKNRAAIFTVFANGDLDNNENLNNYISRKLEEKKIVSNLRFLKENFSKNNIIFLN